jgi:hypothetical protein
VSFNDPTKKRRYAPPRATSMLESLRGLGYSVETALADILDNSISACATEVNVDFHWDGAMSRITVLDNGNGMSDIELEKAMQLGAISPLEIRDEKDLGRFGLGLKTASFSKCRMLTVASKRDNIISCLRWDLDEISSEGGDEWYLMEGPAEGSATFINRVDNQAHGSLVLWENLDRIISNSFTETDFLDLVDRVEKHFEMVFHRYIDGASPLLKIFINGKGIKPWDPFLTGHVSKPWITPPIAHPSGNISVECHVLPHKDMLTQKEYDSASGPQGWTSQQGFYIYRNKRLLLAGSWLGLGKGRSWNKEEAFRLARIKLDITNTIDDDWNINILKSTAHPPVVLREWLLRYAEFTRSKARKSFAWRGVGSKSVSGESVEQVWNLEEFGGGSRYKIDRGHSIVRNMLSSNKLCEAEFDSFLKVLETTVPVQRIWLDTIDHKETPRTHFGGESDAQIKSVMVVVFGNLVNGKKMSIDEARNKLLRMEPFHNFPEIVASLNVNDLGGGVV